MTAKQLKQGETMKYKNNKGDIIHLYFENKFIVHTVTNSYSRTYTHNSLSEAKKQFKQLVSHAEKVGII